MTAFALGGAALLQLLAGVVRARAWFHVIRHNRPEWSFLRYRDVVLAHLAGVGWNAVLPARAGDAVKVVSVNRATRDRRLALLASTLVPPAVVEAVFTALLLAGLVATGLVSLTPLASSLPSSSVLLVIAGAAGLGLACAVVLRRRLGRVLHSVRAGLTVLAQPRVIATRVVPWLIAGRAIRLLAFALVLPAAGVSLGLSAALALMALHGATPSAGAAATAARIAVLATVLSGTQATSAPAEDVAGALAAAYALTSGLNLAVSVAVTAWLLRTTSPRRVAGYVRSALRSVRREPAATSLKAVTDDDLVVPIPATPEVAPRLGGAF